MLWALLVDLLFADGCSLFVIFFVDCCVLLVVSGFMLFVVCCAVLLYVRCLSCVVCCLLLAVGCWVFVDGFYVSVMVYCVLAVVRSVGRCLLPVGGAVCCVLSVIRGLLMSVVRCSRCALLAAGVCYVLFAVCSLLLCVVCCSLCVVRCALFDVCCLFLAVGCLRCETGLLFVVG